MTSPAAPLSWIGILGDGQLGRMLALAAARLGLNVHVYGPDANGPAHAVAARSTIAAYEDDAALTAFAAQVDVATFEFENVPVSAARLLAGSTRLAPGANALEVAQDRVTEKNFIRELGIEVARFSDIPDALALEREVSGGFGDAILKSRRFGYDGKGQVRLSGNAGTNELTQAHGELAGAPAILEALVPFDYEISVVAARASDGSFVPFEPARNVHRSGILDTSTVPAGLNDADTQRAQAIARGIMDALDYVGVMGVELFAVREGDETRLLVNEIAPRVHNSGHWTMDACTTCQFEQHIRAVCGWPLGDPSRHADVVMHNLIGADVDQWQQIAAETGACLHLYGKAETRAGRKMGHVNRLSART
ncbi:5-(carboxyamino)imidazole ribonucleotide synthase [Tepidamorphus sp. 3E244]|uniref:5-(carboxyamino)imidazole ribonucleotide synthase n=1 Tax=Tepidamorphus sp. 3E244 TaxID=3385498 RepID=UPI0038FC7167